MVIWRGNRSIGRAVGRSFCVVLAVIVMVLAFAIAANTAKADTHTGPLIKGEYPDGVISNPKDPQFWWNLRQGERGRSNIPNDQAGQAGILIEADGQLWRMFQAEYLPRLGAWALSGILTVLVLFLMVRGRIRIQAGFSENTILRFRLVERLAHWLLASSFLILAITGLNIVYGDKVIKSLIGYIAFAKMTYYGKVIHDFTGYAFIVGLIFVLALWARDAVPKRCDVTWLARGGGMFSKNVHPPAGRFNAGQKIFFWLLVVIGTLISFTGICLVFPNSFLPLGDFFGIADLIGFGLPAELSALQQLRLAHAVHAVLAMLMIVVAIVHVYLGSVGMEGAIDAMVSGHVDENLAREHHSLWVAELDLERPPVRIALPEERDTPVKN